MEAESSDGATLVLVPPSIEGLCQVLPSLCTALAKQAAFYNPSQLESFTASGEVTYISVMEWTCYDIKIMMLIASH